MGGNMATKTATPKIGVRSSMRRHLSFGLVNVGISLAPALDTSTRVGGKMLDPEGLTPVKQQYVNALGKVVTPVKGYAHGDGFVTLQPDELPSDGNDSTIKLAANVESVPPEFIDATYLCWPSDSTGDQTFALIADYLRSTGRAFIGETVANGTTKVFAIRWAGDLGCVTAHLLTASERVRWENVEKIRDAIDAVDVPEALSALGAQVFEQMDTAFDYGDVTDEYATALSAAISAKGEGRTPTPTADGASAPQDAPDSLMAALQASYNGKEAT
jgi:Ku protein